jgi:hypothetical protein
MTTQMQKLAKKPHKHIYEIVEGTPKQQFEGHQFHKTETNIKITQAVIILWVSDQAHSS